MHNEFNILYTDDNDDQKTLAEELSGGVRYVALRYGYDYVRVAL